MRGNPLQDFIPDELFFRLKSKGFLNERAVRDYYMKQRFENLKKSHPPKRIFSILQEEFPYAYTQADYDSNSPYNFDNIGTYAPSQNTLSFCQPSLV